MAGTKRASEEGTGPRKRARSNTDFTDAKELVEAVLDGDASDGLGAADALKVAKYVRWLESAVEQSKPEEQSPAEVAGRAEKLQSACVSGIKKQMSWKPSCKTGTAKWSYDGVCPDAAVFAALLGLSAPPKWKMHKYTVAEFEDIIGRIKASARYSSLYLRGSVNVRYQPDEGTFKMSGSYGC
ncbi:hypothetical protein MIND_00638300 [Mycena indigotica]|uniref:Uncharacterized protein n=1 Tax=Mycena indigotica TaxID=2126181 RepID=A0A8H6W736_9AGAR|nr:uncharacterized protein MIND_00638300 [Mycena indigotica]KAF7304068.1 hypothetical protein MIND_00638300 [Mycena indigotica]